MLQHSSIKLNTLIYERRVYGRVGRDFDLSRSDDPKQDRFWGWGFVLHVVHEVAYEYWFIS